MCLLLLASLLTLAGTPSMWGRKSLVRQARTHIHAEMGWRHITHRGNICWCERERKGVAVSAPGLAKFTRTILKRPDRSASLPASVISRAFMSGASLKGTCRHMAR